MRNYNDDSYFLLYANCMPVKGAARSLICDLLKGKYYYIPNDLFEILQQAKTTKLIDIFNPFEENERKIIDEYIAFLLENDLGFIDTEPAVFPEMNIEWDYPATITNSIIDIDEDHFSKINYKKVFNELNHFNCTCIQLRGFNLISLSTLEYFLEFTLDSRIREIRLVLKYDKEGDDQIKNKLLVKHKRIGQIIFFNSPKNYTETILGVPFIYLDIENLNVNDCGQICRGLFTTNISHYTEALNFNSCLNRKVSLDVYGNIKNCPSQNESFGNINDTTFQDVIGNRQFQYLWKIKKDDISI